MITRLLAALLLGLAASTLGSVPGAQRGESAAEGAQVAPAWMDVLESLKFYGDLRLRHESDFRANASTVTASGCGFASERTTRSPTEPCSERAR